MGGVGYIVVLIALFVLLKFGSEMAQVHAWSELLHFIMAIGGIIGLIGTTIAFVLRRPNSEIPSRTNFTKLFQKSSPQQQQPAAKVQ